MLCPLVYHVVCPLLCHVSVTLRGVTPIGHIYLRVTYICCVYHSLLQCVCKCVICFAMVIVSIEQYTGCVVIPHYCFLILSSSLNTVVP